MERDSGFLWDLVVVGGGAAGFFCAANLLEQHPDARILIVESSQKILSKVKISGGGRCNVTHACWEPKELVLNYPRGKKELLGPFHRFACGDTMEWFSNRGVELKIEEDGRVFPISDSSQTIIDCLIKHTLDKGIRLNLGCKITAIKTWEEGYILESKTGMLSTKNVLWATGGTESSYKVLADLGVQLDPRFPSLFSMNIADAKLKKMSGLAVPNAEVGIPRLKLNASGPLLITHWGISGPAVLKLSAFGAEKLAEIGYQTEITINWVGLLVEEILEMLEDDQKQYPKMKLAKLRCFPVLPKRLWSYLVFKAGLDEEAIFGSLAPKHLKKLAEELGKCELRMDGKTTYKEEFVTGGGIHLREINFKTMELKKLPGFYACGEVLNIDGVTGGFNFQNAWTGAFIAAEAMANDL
ncbi:aminoacetone oxidase family FAD-binding enzyme [Luteibaculum oceani]|uniref:Aminoacetone oxidase family FAD-binding enzyme n=1 Tax=Luteibaculum oceani TaxID=1294296 RepID=A0A5C6VFG4_9FLAO|nr:aminoacetone oxidase family FAD-binding enzyme [Luteibaculum oceani]TXC82068.1 aminoacetone oxidase family FAD-binding enzyme [Luteibaculum oceani]